MIFDKLYDVMRTDTLVKIVDGVSGKTIYMGKLLQIPHSIYEDICLYEVDTIYLWEREDDYSYEPYLVMEVFE